MTMCHNVPAESENNLSIPFFLHFVGLGDCTRSIKFGGKHITQPPCQPYYYFHVITECREFASILRPASSMSTCQ